MKRISIFILIPAMVGSAVLAQEAEPTITYDLASETFAEMLVLLDQSINLASTAVLGAEVGTLRGERQEYAQGILNLLEGPDSELYEEADDFVMADQLGLLPLMDQLRTLSGGAPVNELFPDSAYGFSNVAVSFIIAWELADSALHKASALAQSMIRPPYTFPWHEELATLYSLLVAARGGNIDDFPLGGISSLAKMFPSREVWVDADESIQDAVDRVPDGGTVYISPGMYRETLSINKNVSLVAASHAPNGLPELGRTVLKGMPWRASIEIASSTPIEVTIRGLVIQDAYAAISVEGPCTVTVLDVRFEGNGTGLYVVNGGIAAAGACHFDRNEHSITLRWGANCTVRDSVIENSPPTAGVISVMCSYLELLSCEIRDNQGSAITSYGGADSALHLVDCSVIRNSQGLKLFRGACPLEPLALGSQPSPSGEHSFGTITGWGNVIPGPDEEDGNMASAFQVDVSLGETMDLSFLIEPKPEEE